MKKSGILMPVASLPGKYGMGSFGKEAYAFVDMLAGAGVRIWQILPLNPLGYGNSPYQPLSSFAGDESYIDLALLKKDGLLEELPAPFVPAEPDRIDYAGVRDYKEPWLRRAYKNFRPDAEYKKFLKYDWVYPYAVFVALKTQNGLRAWVEWPKEQQDWILDRKYDISHLEDEIGYRMFAQFEFYRQWMALKKYAAKKGVQIMGDIPFYVGLDSLDVWGAREEFLINGDGEPSFIAGVPPDYFNADGQRWGNPIYDWEYMKKTNYRFWIERLRYSSVLYDILRIDHFRAFDTYWKIPASCPTARDGEWIEAPGYELFDEVFRRLPKINIVAEDLGDLRPEVLQLRDHYGLMGMNVVEFTLLDGIPILPNQLVYTGTHDNQTVTGWYKSQSKFDKKRVLDSLSACGTPHTPIAKKFVRYIMKSPAAIAIVPLSDVLGYDDRARLNTPGTVGSPNWEWRLASFAPLRRRLPWLTGVLKETKRK